MPCWLVRTFPGPMRACPVFEFIGATVANLIQPNGRIDGLTLGPGQFLTVQNYHGSSPIPILIDQHWDMSTGGTIRFEFDGTDWNSRISFVNGIPVKLGGTLDLAFTPNTNILGQIGRTFNLFDWSNVFPLNSFAVTSPYQWDLSHLYSTGTVTLLNVPGALVPGDFDRDGSLSAKDLPAMLLALADINGYKNQYGLSDGALLLLGDFNDDHRLTNADLQAFLGMLSASGISANTVPEPATIVLVALWLAIVVCVRIPGNRSAISFPKSFLSQPNDRPTNTRQKLRSRDVAELSSRHPGDPPVDQEGVGRSTKAIGRSTFDKGNSGTDF